MLRYRLFGRKSEQSVDPDTPQLAMYNEAECEPLLTVEDPELAMLLTIKYVDGLPLHRFESVLRRHGVEIPRQTLARWIIQCREHFQPLLNVMRERLLESPVIHSDKTRVQVLIKPDRDPTNQSWM